MNNRKKSMLALLCFLILTQAEIRAQEQQGQILSLLQLYERADSCSRSIKSAKATADVAEANIQVSKNALLPEINFSASGSVTGNVWIADRDFSNGQWIHGPHFGNNFALEVMQVLYAGGAIKHNIEATELQAELARLGWAAERQKIRFLLTGYYLNLYKFRNMLKVYDRNIERTQKVIDDMKAREQQGIALSNDITRYEVQMQNLLYRRTELLSQIDVFNNQLVTSLDLPKEMQIMPDTTLLALTMQEYTETELQNMAETHSPRLKMSETSIDLNRQRQKIARAGLLPKISIVAADHLQGPITFELPPIDKNVNTWYVGLGVSYNIGNLYKSSKEINQSKLAVAEAKTKHTENLESVKLEVHQAYVNYRNAFELLRTQEKSLQLATENYAVTEKRYNNDLVLLIDLLDADNIKLDTEIQTVNARINIVFNYYKLLYVTGTI